MLSYYDALLVKSASSISFRSAVLTDSESGKTFATSGDSIRIIGVRVATPFERKSLVD